MADKEMRLLGQHPLDRSTLRFRQTPEGPRMDPVQAQVMSDIRDRDQADVDRGTGSSNKLDIMAMKDALIRQNRMGMISSAAGGYNSDTGLGLAPPSQEMKLLQENLARNKQWVRPGAAEFGTKLAPQEEAAFISWVNNNRVPFNVASPVADYDMRGFWKALQSGDKRAATAINPNDNAIHYPDFWKTPYHHSFSNESQWALASAPKWNDVGQLVARDGSVVYDERAATRETATKKSEKAKGDIKKLRGAK